MPLWWGLPFAGLILSVALLPALAPRVWHRRMEWGVTGWVLALLGPMLWLQGRAAVLDLLNAALLSNYLPFISLIAALSVVGGGIMLRGGPFGRPGGNTLLLAIGFLLAGVMGTSGASLILIHPLLQANAHRVRKFHLVLFFIALVANAGGALMPLGPPLYLGLLAGVPFFWPLRHLGPPVGLFAALLLLIFYFCDRFLAAREAEPPPPPARLHFRGLPNLLLAAVAVTSVGLPRLHSVLLCWLVMLLSWFGTSRAVRQANMWSPHPLREVAVLFAGLFIVMQPVVEMLRMGANGPLAFVIDAARTPGAYYWIAGWLSAFLDNTPTYQLLLAASGGDTHRLVGLSLGSVLFGALTYVGNAPNMMIQSIAAHRGVRMPGFLGYFLRASLLLLPLLALLWALFLRTP
jgi:Na+/H+ antiporter NhaD/arsenite permease-like protein